MSKQTTDPPSHYIRPSELARILNWPRSSIYYWLNRCRIDVVTIAGHKLIPIEDLPALVLTLQKARKDAHEGNK